MNGSPVGVDVERGTWRFLTSHASALLCIRRDPELRVRDLAVMIGITERRAQGIVSDLVEAGYLVVEKVGRRNRYTVCGDMPLRNPLFEEQKVEKILGLAPKAASRAAAAA
jgi:hypothetical protein